MSMIPHTVGTAADHLDARLELLHEEKELTRRSDELAARRRALPWVAVERDYRFDTPSGEQTLADLFAGRSQLVVYHFMLGPGWGQGCPSCSFWTDGFTGVVPQLTDRDVTMITVSRAPLDEIEAYRRRMGWTHTWASTHRTTFNEDFGVSFDDPPAAGSVYNFTGVADYHELPGLSAFAMEDGVVYHTYSAYGRGIDVLSVGYQLLDRTPRGRDEPHPAWKAPWIRRHDEIDLDEHATGHHCCQ